MGGSVGTGPQPLKLKLCWERVCVEAYGQEAIHGGLYDRVEIRPPEILLA